MKVLRSVDELPRDLQNKSGIYVIYSRETGKPLYVGESHTNQLRSTLMRHFYPWKMDWMHQQPRAVYNRHRVSIYVELTSSGTALERQNTVICELEPRDNIRITGCEPF